MTLNTDSELTRERIEEDKDFKIPGLPHSVKISNYRKLATKTVFYSMNINSCDENNKHDTNYINKHKYTNTDTRKLHL